MDKSPDISRAKISSNDPLLAKFRLFAELSHDELDAMVAHCNIVHVPAGHRVISAGERGHCMYVILKGEVRVTAPDTTPEIEFAVLKGGDFLGEIALVDDGLRSANVTALQDCELLSITRMTLGLLAGLHPSVAIHILAAIGRSLVARLRSGNKRYVDILLTGDKTA